MIAPGAILDRYEILRPLAAGGMGEIHLARLHGAAGFGSLVAIKVLIGNLSTNKAFVSMFLDEARNVAKLRHKNIVQIRDINRHAGQYYMVMEYIPGQNLRELLGDVTISATPLFGPKLGAEVFSDLASALTAVHHAGLVHRDLSPNNIMIGDEGVAKLIDFGVARALGSASLTNPGTLKGKFTYMAPEYIKSQSYDHRVDLFSLGVVMWETFSRRRLFRGGNAAEQLHQVLEAPIPRLDQVIGGFPAPLADVVAACVVRDPEQRIASAVEVADRLGELARELPETGERTLRRWLERHVGDRIDARRQDDRAIMERGPEVMDVPPVQIEISTTLDPVRTATPLPTRVSGFHAIGRSMGSATSVRMAAGEAIAPVTPRSRTRLFVAAGASVAVLAIVVAVATSRGGAGAPPPATPSVAPRPSADAELHRQRGISALQAKNYVGAISELAEAIRIGGADADLLQLMELARRLQHDAHESAAVPLDAGVLDAAAIDAAPRSSLVELPPRLRTIDRRRHAMAASGPAAVGPIDAASEVPATPPPAPEPPLEPLAPNVASAPAPAPLPPTVAPASASVPVRPTITALVPTPRVDRDGDAAAGVRVLAACNACHAARHAAQAEGQHLSRAQWERFFATGRHDRYVRLGDRFDAAQMMAARAWLRATAADAPENQAAGVR